MRSLLRACLMTLALTFLVGLCAEGGPAEPARKPSNKPGLPTGTLENGVRLDAQALAGHIDRLINQRLRADKVEPSPRCDDSEFLRRVYLDLTGHVPTAEQAVAFLDSKDQNRRGKLIDELLANKDFGRHQADLWQSMLLPHDSDALRLRQYFPSMTTWLEESFNAGKPWDRMVRELLTATGPVDKPGPAVYYIANGTVDKLTDNFTKLILGVQLQCAQCHNHPFTDWKKDEYWGMAAFFMKVRPDGNPKAAAKNGDSISISEGKQVVANKRRLPESAKILPPKFLQGDRAKVGERDLYRPALADWATSPQNPFFARAMVNRVWSQLFGRGFVAPVDDMHEGNAPSHPELLTDLAGQFTASGFDVKYLTRAVCNSEAYQRSSKSIAGNRDHGPEVVARMSVKVLSPEQLYDSLTQILGKQQNRAEARGKAAGKQGPITPRSQFVASFAIDDGADPTEYQAGIPQVLRLMNSAQFNNAGVVASLIKNSKDRKEITEKLYLTTLARRPSPGELARFETYLATNKDESNKAHADLLWALINCSEFSLNR